MSRLAVTVRFNDRERQDLRALMEFYGCNDPKVLLQLAYNQFKTATNELQRKLADKASQEAAQEKDNGQDHDGSSVDANGAGSQLGTVDEESPSAADQDSAGASDSNAAG